MSVSGHGCAHMSRRILYEKANEIEDDARRWGKHGVLISLALQTGYWLLKIPEPRCFKMFRLFRRRREEENAGEAHDDETSVADAAEVADITEPEETAQAMETSDMEEAPNDVTILVCSALTCARTCISYQLDATALQPPCEEPPAMFRAHTSLWLPPGSSQ
jgi:hypothetical protein